VRNKILKILIKKEVINQRIKKSQLKRTKTKKIM